MGDATYKVSTTHRHEFRLNSPTPAAEIQKALRWASQEFKKHRGREVEYDDDLMVQAYDEYVIVYFTVDDR